MNYVECIKSMLAQKIKILKELSRVSLSKMHNEIILNLF